MLDNQKNNQNLIDYDDSVGKLFKMASTSTFGNHGVEHARIVCKHIFLHAKKEVCILSNNLPEDYHDKPMYSWGELQDAVHNFLDVKKGSLRILIASKDDEKIFPDSVKQDHKMFANTTNKESISISYIDPSLASCNYTLGDGRMYRFEEDAGAEDAAASACANNSFFGDVLQIHFDARFPKI